MDSEDFDVAHWELRELVCNWIKKWQPTHIEVWTILARVAEAWATRAIVGERKEKHHGGNGMKAAIRRMKRLRGIRARVKANKATPKDLRYLKKVEGGE